MVSDGLQLKTLHLILCSLILQSFGVQGQRLLTDTIADYNKDGYMDTFCIYYDGGGSAFGGRTAKLSNGKSGEVYIMDIFSSFSEIQTTYVYPNALTSWENRSFLNVFKKHLLPEERKTPDPSLQWIINSTYNHIDLDSNKFFDLVLKPELPWVVGQIKLPSSYYIQLFGDSLPQMITSSQGVVPSNAIGALVYRPHNHYSYGTQDTLTLVHFNDSHKIYKTAHGVVIQKENSYKWLFITDAYLTGAPEKLRWESIKKVELVGGYLLIHQDLAPTTYYHIFVINVESGICGRLKFGFTDSHNFDSDNPETFFIEDSTLLIRVEGNTLKLELQEVFKELESL